MSGKVKLHLIETIAAVSLIAVPVAFCNAQEVSAPKQNANTKSWKNADFNTAVPDSKRPRAIRFKNVKGWQFTDEKELVPAEWRISSDAVASYEQESEGNYFIRLKKGSQEKSVLKISFKARGTGSFYIWTCSYKDKEKSNSGYESLKDTQKFRKWNLTSKWKTYEFATETIGVPTERVAIRFTVLPKGTLNLDDVFVSIEPKSK